MIHLVEGLQRRAFHDMDCKKALLATRLDLIRSTVEMSRVI
jgi:hypothetical protein